LTSVSARAVARAMRRGSGVFLDYVFWTPWRRDWFMYSTCVNRSEWFKFRDSV